MKNKFTLVELLVVIAIIAILSSMLMPTLGKARSVARNVSCVSNLRQIAQANMLYASDNDEFSVPYNTASGMGAAGDMWMGESLGGGTYDLTRNNLLGPYLGDEYGVMICPDVILDGTPEAVEGGGGGYGYNANWFGSYNNMKSVKLAAVKRPSKTIIFGDNARTSMGPYTYDPPQYVPLMNCKKKPDGTEYTTGTTHFRHSEKANIAWVDGHVTSEHVGELNTDDISQENLIGFVGVDDQDFYHGRNAQIHADENYADNRD